LAPEASLLHGALHFVIPLKPASYNLLGRSAFV